MQRYDELSYSDSNVIVRDHVCAQCWGTLMQDFDAGKPKDQRYKVICPECGEDRGFVTRSYAEQRRANSGAEAWEAARNLGSLLGMNSNKLTQEDAIKALYP